MPNNDSHQHVVKTSEQWNERIVEFWVVPRGCLCVELTPNGKTKIKIGEGNKYYSQLPYICDGDDLSQYYTKEEVNNLFENFNRMAIMSTDEYDRKADLPMTGNKLGDVRFVKSSSPSITTDPDIYLWNGRKWIYVGNQFPEIDLNKYLKKTEFHELFDPVKERVDDIGPKVDEMYPMRHTHANKDILDNTTASYTSEEKTKLAGLHNYDAEISDLQSKSHIHDNKSFLDTITQEYQIWSQEDRYKFDHIKNYDQDITEIRVYIQTLESIAHTHANKNILDQVTAAFTVEDKTKLDSLHNDTPFIGTDGMYPGVEGNVPAPLTTDVGKFLSSDGTWRPISEASDFIGATDERDGYHGLVPAPLAGEESYFLKGDGTWSEVPEYELPPATTTTLGGIIVGNNLTIDEDGVLSAQAGGESYSEGDGIEFKNVNPYGIPSEYTVVEYIGNTSNSYILTDYVPNTNTKIVMDINAHQGTAAWQTIFGARDAVYPGGNEYAFFSRCDSDYKFYPRITGNTYTYMAGTYDERITVTIDGTLITVEKEDHTSYSYTQSGSLANLSNAMTIFALHNGNLIGDAGIIDLYSFKIYENNALVKQYIPCYRNSDDVIGLYETINGVFYTNGGTGTFSKGNDVDTEKTINAKLGIGLYFDTNDAIAADVYDAGDGLFLGVEYTHNQNTDIPETYLQVEYLESTGTQYINTGQRYDTSYYHYEVDCEIDNENNNQMFGMRYWYDHAIDIYGGVYQACDSSSYIINSTIPAGDRVYCTLDRPTKTTTIESDSTTFTHTFSSDYSPSSSVYPVVLFAYWTSWSDSLSGYGKGKIYSFKYYSSSDTLTREMYPCIRKSDNVPGMYDTVNNVFYTNNGTGDFSYGDPLTVTDYIPGNTFNVKLGSGLYFDSNGRIAASGGGGGSDYTAGEGIDIATHAGTIPVDMFTGKENLYENYAYTSRTSSEAVPYSLVVLSRNSSAWTEPIGDEFYIEAYDNNDKPLWAYLTFYNSSNTHYYESDPSKSGTHDNLSNYSSYTQALEHIGIGINRLPDSATVWDIDSRMSISPSEIKSITLVWYDSTTSDTKTISAKLGEGLDFDANNAITAKLGSGLYFDSSGRIAASGGGGGGTTYQAGDGINITSGATPSIEAKLGEGLHFDTNDAIAADVYTAGQGISMSNPSGISVLNQQYYFDTQVTCSLSGSFQRSFQKTTNEPALGALINVHNVGQSDSWTGPVFVGLTESSVKCTYNTDNVIGPFTYKGKTWYCTGANWWVDGSLTDDNHNILRIPGQNQSVFPDEINDFTIAKLIIDTAGLLDNNDKVITAKLGSGLTFDDNNAIELDDAIKIRLNCNNEPN